MELDPLAVAYFNTFDWKAFFAGDCTPGTWSNCCVDGIPKLCLSEEEAAASKPAKSPCGGGSSIHDVVIAMIRAGSDPKVIKDMVKFLTTASK